MKRFLLTLLPAAAWAQEKPNVIWLMADDLGYGDISCYGATRVQTPNIDRVASQGVRFTDMHACASTSTPRITSAAATAAASNAFKRVLCIDVSLFVSGGVKTGVFAAISYASLNLAKPKTAFKKDEVI